MFKLFRALCPLVIVISLTLTGLPEVFAKKSGSSKNSKQKTQSRGNSKKSSKKSSGKAEQAKNQRSRRNRTTAATRREKSAPDSAPETDKPRPTANQSETPLTPGQARNNNTYSSAEQDSQEAAQPPAPRAVISSIPTERVAEIQTALIKQGYLQGEASGIYDDNTKAAMKKFQLANNLQASGLPSAHALKRLGVSKRGNSLSQVPVKTKSDVEKQPPQN